MSMSAQYAEGHVAGIQAGWDDANYGEAYGDPRTGADNALRARYLLDNVTDDFESGFTTGYDEGSERFDNGQYPDGADAS